MTIEEMRERKRELGLSYEQIAERSGLPLGTVQKVLGGITKAPRYETVTALEKVFLPSSRTVYSEGGQPDRVCEPPLSYGSTDSLRQKRQGEYTLEDYFAIPKEQRVELIDGVIYDVAAPTTIHQILVTQIWMSFFHMIQERKGDCVPIVSPVDVQLDLDDRTMVQPDVIVVCDRRKLDKLVYGSPDLVVEIMSPSSARLDNRVKLMKYENAGVKDYWIVDSEKKRILAYHFVEDDWPAIYSFDDKIPVHIFSEVCEIDFSKIHEYVKFMYEQ